MEYVLVDCSDRVVTMVVEFVLVDICSGIVLVVAIMEYVLIDNNNDGMEMTTIMM